MDTGSADLWIPWTMCNSSVCMNKTKYDPDSSTTFRADGKSFSFGYATGNCSGTLANDVIAGICVDNQTFGMADELASAFLRLPFDGICGLAFQTVADQNILPPVQHMINENLLENPWFTVWMTYSSEDVNSVGGQLTLGDYDSVHCSSSCDWIPLSNAGFYQIKLQTFRVKIGLLIISSNETDAISDTGTSLIAGPDKEINKIARILNASLTNGVYFVPCSSWGDLPSIVFTINGKDYNVSSKNYVIQDKNKCFLGFQSTTPIGSASWILGDVWIREYCQVYDMGNKRLGICENHDKGFNRSCFQCVSVIEFLIILCISLILRTLTEF